MYKILFVCHGNICRSPMAEFVMRAKIEAAGLSDRVYVESAAVSSEELGNPVYPGTKKVLAEHGISCAGKFARQMTRADYDRFDLLLGMEYANCRIMKQIVGKDPDAKIKRLLDFTDKPDDIDDPWYHRDFNATYELVDRGCGALLEFVRRVVNADDGSAAPERR